MPKSRVSSKADRPSTWSAMSAPTASAANTRSSSAAAGRRSSAAGDAGRGRPEIADDFRGTKSAGLTGAEIQHLLRLCGPVRGFVGIFSAEGLRDVEAASVVPTAALAQIQRPAGDRMKRPEGDGQEREQRPPQRKRRRRQQPCRTVAILNVGLHWVTVCLDSRYVVYIDSLGNPPALPVVRNFLGRCAAAMGLSPRADVFYTRRVVQALESNYCGLFVVLWSLALAMTAPGAQLVSLRAVNDAEIRFWRASHRLSDNDALCAKYLRELAVVASTVDHETVEKAVVGR